jgi:hypothetical protein
MSDNRGATATLGTEGLSGTAQSPVTAIDILLEPDTRMLQHAQAANALLLKDFPKGFALGNEHQPHVTVLQRHVYTAELDKLFAAAADVFATEKVTSWELTAFRYYYIPQKDIGLGGIVAKPTPDLLRLQNKLIDAVAPFTAPKGTAAAYVTTPQDPDILPAVVDYVAAFVPEHSGAHYSPHVTIGVGTAKYLDAMLAAPFSGFTFGFVGASVYHLGNYGMAMTKLHSFELESF